jgi:mRNA-degrading endonuclease YafQ of YafQ-DinJ toxin-antitoxin module
MKYKIIYTNSYNKRAAKFIKKHPDLIGQYEKTLKLLELNPFHPSLHFHKLSGTLNELYSVSINISYRITMEFIISEKTIIPVKIGTHDEAYSKAAKN